MADSEQIFPEARERAVRMLQEHRGDHRIDSPEELTLCSRA